MLQAFDDIEIAQESVVTEKESQAASRTYVISIKKRSLFQISRKVLSKDWKHWPTLSRKYICSSILPVHFSTAIDTSDQNECTGSFLPKALPSKKSH